MANFTRANVAGWADYPAAGHEITAAQINALDIDHAKAINGDEGSSHTPAAQIELGGAGLGMAGPLNLRGTAAVMTWRKSPALADTGHTFSTDYDHYRLLVPVGADRMHDLMAAGTSGRRITISCPGGAGNNHYLRRLGAVGDYIVQLQPSVGWASATVEDDGTNWRLLTASGAVVMGAHA